MNALSTTILLPYGIFEESNLQYKKYLDEAFEIISQRPNDQIILCGGLTNVKSNQSEAQSLDQYLKKQHPNLKNSVFLEEKSITTPENLQFAKEILINNKIQPSSLQIICDSIRVPKIYYFALTHFSSFMSEEISEEEIYRTLLSQFTQNNLNLTQQIKVEHKNISIVGLNLHRTEQELGQQILSTMEEVAGFRFPKVEQDILQNRRKLWHLIQNQL